MRRPINWVVFCLSLLCLYANLSFGRGPAPPAGQVAALTTSQMEFSHVVIAEPASPRFGYVRADGSFLPLAEDF